jgi:peptidoglycan/LPS O-acetylase OafA/YrhL
MLRIWPLYFLIFFIGTLLLPQVLQLLNIQYQMPYQFGQVWYYFVFFLPGLVTFYFGHHLLEPLWSIGVEEVFYLIWAPIFKFFKKRLLIILFAIIILKSTATLMSVYVFHSTLLTFTLDIFKFDAMAIGALGAYVVFNLKQSVSHQLIYRKMNQVIIYGLLLVYLVFHDNIKNQYWDLLFKTPILSELLIDSLFIYLIIGVSLVDQSIIKLENKALSFLGEISYGIYMYHMLIIFAIMQFGKAYFAELSLFSGTLLFYITLLALVIGTASISKKYFEDIFLKIKRKIEARLR